MTESKRVYDHNGWFEVKDNPLSKVGIYDYSGAQIGAPADRAHEVFKVYRPAEELAAAETIESFKLSPFINDHTMLGHGFTSTDERPVAGVVGESVYFSGDTLYGNIKVYSNKLAEAVKSGKTELSCGYRCRYEFTPGVFDGKPYDVVQRTIRGNHLALVDEGRMGPEVSILDHLTFTVDAKESFPVDMEKIEAVLTEILARLDKLEGGEEKVEVIDEDDDAKPADEDEAKDEEVVVEPADEVAPAAEVEEKAEEVAELADDLAEIAEELSVAADAKTIAKLVAKVGKLRTRAAMDAGLRHRNVKPAMDEAKMVRTLARRNSLVERLSGHIGTFDHATMTTQQVAEYGVKKLGIRGVPKGGELVALDAALQTKAKPEPVATRPALDNSNSGLAKRLTDHVKGA